MISGLGAGLLWGGENPGGRVWWLCGGVMVGGLLQLFVPWHTLKGEEWRWRWDARRDHATREVWQLFLPGVVGAAIFQANIVVSRLLAFGLNEAAAGILYLANRLVELPLGVFAISITTVFFPALTKDAARGEPGAFFRTYEQGLRLIFAITLPAAIGLFVLAEPILRALFEWGLFASSDVARTVWPLRVFALGLPLYAWATLATRGLHSWKEMKLPVKIGALNALLNLILSVILLGPLGEVGLALANVLAALAFAILLERGLRGRELESANRGTLLRELGKMLVAAGLMGLFAAGWSGFARGWVDLPLKLEAVLVVAGGVPLGIGVYVLLLFLLRSSELQALRDLGRRRWRSRR
jgi:putative peptidoglycan lipid II flippase